MTSDTPTQVSKDTPQDLLQNLLGSGGEEGQPLSGIEIVSRSAATTDAIKAYILRRGLGPGDPLPTEAKLCADLQVSRSSVREALRKLQALDIVVIKQGRGTFVGEMSLTPMVETLVLRSALGQRSNTASLREVVKVRRYLDLGLTHDTVSTLSGTTNPDLRECVDEMKAKAVRGEKFMDEDIAFHNGLLERIDGTLAQQLTASMWLVHMAVVPDLGPSPSEGQIKTAEAHEHMLDAAEAGDATAYQQAVWDHYAHLEDLLTD
ncbi:FadR/GntR family transcriptional regulator [Nesterenkonia sp. K-15-9-6]|uniref:FadR/GntR family transcriptional regulator n=1 Tax=Nesterenkonia sp. K-15-9-6 TaxID=3093918 RepID=UPI0040449921